MLCNRSTLELIKLFNAFICARKENEGVFDPLFDTQKITDELDFISRTVRLPQLAGS